MTASRPVPRAPPSCRVKFIAPDPWLRNGGTTISEPARGDGKTNPMPTRLITVHHASVQKAVSTLTHERSHDGVSEDGHAETDQHARGAMSLSFPAKGEDENEGRTPPA